VDVSAAKVKEVVSRLYPIQNSYDSSGPKTASFEAVMRNLSKNKSRGMPKSKSRPRIQI
jgi:hypothetical protein